MFTTDSEKEKTVACKTFQCCFQFSQKPIAHYSVNFSRSPKQYGSLAGNSFTIEAQK
jgi:hypothetical protein